MIALRAATPAKSTAEWLRLCGDQGIPASSVLDLASAHTDSYLRERGVLTPRDHPTEGAYWSTTTPFTLSDTPVTFARHAPHIGEHTTELLGELGYEPSRVSALAAAGVIRDAHLIDQDS
jgi:crotonobetainyl-CoA:carnitine CoA-transferase CaiB-like acyl-CoA transferase